MANDLRTPRWLLIAAFALTSFGCATGPAGSPTEPPADVSGVWSGTIAFSATSKVGCCGGGNGPVHVEFEQNGESVTGTLHGVGFRGTVRAFVRGNQILGSFSYTVGQGSGSSSFEGTVAGNEMLVATVDGRLILSRAR